MIAENAVSRYPFRMRPVRSSAVIRGVDAPALLVTDILNIRYLTGVKLTSGILLISAKGFELFVDGRYTEIAEDNARKGIRVRPHMELDKTLSKLKRCAFESENITVARFTGWKKKFKNTKFVQSSGVIEEFRRSKDAEELKCFRKAQSITQAMIAKVPALLRRPISEHAVAWKLREWAMEMGADGLAFEPIVAFGTHSSRPHHRPTDRVLKKGNIVQIDVGAVYRGYAADQSAIFFTAKPTPLQMSVYAAVADAYVQCCEAVKTGVTNVALDAMAREILKGYGYADFFVHSLGHGVGLDVHEGVNLSSRAPEKKLLKNEIVTIEPGVYLPGKFGIRLEKEVVVGS